MPGDTENENDTKCDGTIIDTNEILALIPHIDRDWAIHVIDLMDYFRNTYGDEERMNEYLIGELVDERNNENDLIVLIQEIHDAEEEVLTRHGLIIV